MSLVITDEIYTRKRELKKSLKTQINSDRGFFTNLINKLKRSKGNGKDNSKS